MSAATKENSRPVPLKVYRASAGSGKTFRLAVEYLKLLIDNPQSYRQTLAVTFTNKATEEMKSRILTHLYGIWKGDQDSQSYLQKVTGELAITQETARQRAGRALHNLLHNYGYMRIETIDSFFQSVLRNLARELELNANLRLTLNDREAEERAVDEMIDGLHRGSKELGWILSYIQDKISDEKSWNVTGQIKAFGENLLKDFYKDHAEELNTILADERFFSRYTEELRSLRDEARKQLETPAHTFFKLTREKGYEADSFSRGKSGVYGYFVKLLNGVFDEEKLLTATVAKAIVDPTAWVRAKDAVAGNELYQLVETRLQPLLADSERHRPTWLRQFKSADLTLLHLSQLRLLRSIEETMRQSNREANRFLLSNTQTLLRRLISDSDSPFIYEKIGARLEHIMIDEFQDTSSTQWANFKVLLNECMSHADDNRNPGLTANLIVGDVKQSIYRWRGGDWQLLSNMEEEFPASAVETEPLVENRRSASRIVQFNNAFFTAAAEIEQAQLESDGIRQATLMKTAYNEVEQKIVGNDGERGFVSVDLLPQEGYKDATLQRVTQIVEDLLAQGHSPSTIAVIVRTNGNIEQVAAHLMATLPDIPLISDEAFRLDSSVAVGIIIDALRHLLLPDDDLATASLAKAYQKYILNSTLSEPDIICKGVDINSFLPKEDFAGREAEYLQMPLTDMVERIVRAFRLDSLGSETAYICAFMDKMQAFIDEGSANLAAFLDEWDSTISSKSIHSDGAEGIRLLTIHKSKGLEFENVIMPFCDWTLEKRYTLWCQPEEMPYGELPIVPVDFSEPLMRGTIYEGDYQREHLHNTVDNMNLLYVGFTRAVSNLYVIGRREKSGTRSLTIGQALPRVAETLPGSTTEGLNTEKTEPVSFSYGQPAPAPLPQGKSRDVSNIFARKEEPINVAIHTYNGHKNFRQSNKSRDFTASEAESEQRQYIRMGSILHQLFSTVRTSDDIPAALQQLERDGILYDENVSRESLHRMIGSRLQDKRVADWFSPRWTLYNECSILFVNPDDGRVAERRPDRVMTDGHEMIVVDFKFGKPSPAHHDQVSLYMHLLRNMGNENVKGFLWYVYSNRIEEVKA